MTQFPSVQREKKSISLKKVKKLKTHSILALNSQRGFTLLELLVAVVIVGILTTVAVPGYRRMVQQARQAEAKSLLGGLHLAESAFFAEHRSYGNDLRNIGFSVEGRTRIYSVGFPNGEDCSSATIAPAEDAGNGIVQGLFEAIPDYGKSEDGAGDAETVSPGIAPLSCKHITTLKLSRKDNAGNDIEVEEVIGVNSDGSSFTGYAAGLLNPTETDTWAISVDRALVHLHNGVK